jgi:quercetin dioxygenase-like cupin family protein
MDTPERGGFFRLQDQPETVVSPHIIRRLVSGENAMLLRIELRQGGTVQTHQHPHEQISYVLSGEVEFDLAGRKQTMTAGHVVCVPGNMPHGLTVLADTVILEIFSPPREDFL